MRAVWKHSVAAVALISALMSTPVRAEIVYDPTNYAQNLLQAARALEQIHNQIQQIEQATRMLAQNPLQLSPEIAGDIAEARRLFTQAQGIAFDLHKVGDDVHALYPEQWTQMNLDEMLAQSDRWLRQDRQSVEQAMAAEARAAEAIARSQGQIDRALQSSSGAEGQTGAIQAGNQLLGISASQLAQIHALLIAQGRALETERMERIAREERAREVQSRAFPTGADVQTTPARSAFSH